MNETGQPNPEHDDQNTQPIGEEVSPQPAHSDSSPVIPPPPAPYGQAPQQPYDPYAQPQAPGGYYPYPQQPNNPYAQAPQQPYGYPTGQPYYGDAGQQPPYPPNYAQQPIQPPHKKKVWPWVLVGCLLVFMLGIGGCVGCMSVVSFMDSRYDTSSSYPLDEGLDPGYSLDDPNANTYEDYGGLALEDIKEAAGDLPNSIVDGRCSAGVYTVGAGKDIAEGSYYLEGSTTAESNFYVFSYDEDTNTYVLDDAVVYFGNYFAEFESGDLVVFMGAENSLNLYATSKATFKPAAPYNCGLFRVGTDIPAGTYTISTSETASGAAQNEYAAYVMKDLDFSTDSITDTKYVLPGGSQNITVKNGDYLELYAVTATPVS